MMVLRCSKRSIEHRQFADFPSYLQPGDLAVLNDTKVIPARVWSDDGVIEFLFLEPSAGNRWLCMAKPGRKLPSGASTSVGGVPGIVREVLPTGERFIDFEAPIDLDRIGQVPIPPYLGRPADASDSERYQTIFARHPGAVAAPTAGLHFTPELLAQVLHTFVTLHVGPGTFKPVQAEDITSHQMHSERFEVTPAAAHSIAEATRLIAIGTTTVRVLESCANPEGRILPQTGATNIFIHPPYQFRVIDALLTNFHLPKSTLLMLVSALAGREFILDAYVEAIRERYRFFSYGDCMLIQP
jgi:S-adenosylmethionine:tRNA ribosyltransferase-isomerase